MSRGAKLSSTAVALAMAVSAFGLTSSAHASPLELFGFGGRSPGLAGAGAADSASFASVYVNPAGLAHIKRKRLTFGTAATRFGLDIDGESAGVDNGTAFVFGGALPMPLGGALEDRVGVGLGFHIPNQALLKVDRPLVGEPTYALLDNRADSLGIQVALGVRVNDRLSVGLGVLILAALRGRIVVENDAAGAFITNSNQRLVTNASPIAGARYQLSSRLKLGLTARGPSRSDYEIAIDSQLTSLPLSLPELAVAGNAQYDPGMVTAGVAWHMRPDVTLLGELEYRRWSAFPSPTDNPVVINPPPPSPGFHDTVVPRLAVEASRQIGRADARLRLGYAFLLSPAPEMKGEITLLDNHRHLFAAGVGISVEIATIPLHLDAWAQLHQLHRRRHQKDPALFDDAPPFDSVGTRGRVGAGGLLLGVDL